MEDLNPEPLSPPSAKSDAELLREHRIEKHCRILLARPARFLLQSARVMPDSEFGYHRKQMPDKNFKVYYGRHVLEQIAECAFKAATDYDPVDFDRLYSTHITSRFAAMDRMQFKSMVQYYFARWQNDFKRRRAELIAKKMAEVNAKKKAEREALKRRKISYKNSVVIVPNGIRDEAKKALRDGPRSKVVLERIFMDSPQSCVSDDQTLPRSDTCQSSVSPSEAGTESDDCVPVDEEEDSDDPRTATHKLIRDLIETTSQELERSGYCDFTEEDYVVQDNTHESSGQTTDECCDSDDTVESPMEVEFGSGESPDFSKVLRISHQEEFGDSEETCHGDEFVTQSRSSYTCDTDQSNSGLPPENGRDSDGKHDEDMNNSCDEAVGNNCVIKQTIRNQNKSIVVVPMKLCN